MKRRILIIEDNRANLDLLTYLLQAHGYEVSYALNGASGLEETARGKYDLVLADILMPEMDGYRFAQLFRADPQNADVRLVAVTALAMGGDEEKILASGFDAYIAKPIDPRKIAAQIESILAKGRHGQRSGC